MILWLRQIVGGTQENRILIYPNQIERELTACYHPIEFADGFPIEE